jgi:hypothetical protein
MTEVKVFSETRGVKKMCKPILVVTMCADVHAKTMTNRIEGQTLNTIMYSKKVQGLVLRFMSSRYHLLLNQQDHSWIIWVLFSFTIGGHCLDK